jgi:hypothetical protein
MHHRLQAALGVAVVMSASTAALASAGSPSRIHFKASAMLATFSTGHGYPGVGGTAVLSGPLTQHPGGSGAEVDHVTILSQSGSTFTSKATGVDYFAHGSERFSFNTTITVQSDGSLKLVGQGKVLGGTDRYAGLRGQFTFTGGAPGPTAIITYHAKGSVTR